MLGLLSATAWAAPYEPPNSRGCRDHFENSPCENDHGDKGTCVSQMINTPDFSVPGPPTFKDVSTPICVGAPAKRSLRDTLFAVGGIALLFSLVVYNMLRRKSLSDYVD